MHLIVVSVVDLKECLFLVINDSMADECYEIEVEDALIRGDAGCLYDIYLFFYFIVNVLLLGVVIGEDYGQWPIQIISEIVFHPFRIWMTHGQLLQETSFLLVVPHPDNKGMPN